MKGVRVFVTGGAGVIGLEAVPKLVAAGADVFVGDLKSRPASFGDAVHYRQGDLNDLTQEELDAIRPDIILHLAASFERSVETAEFWEENFRHNVLLSHHLMGLARNCLTLRRVVFASSYLIYDEALYQFSSERMAAQRLSEDAPVRPRNLVGMAKLAHEAELRFLTGFQDCQFSTLCVRIFRGYGKNSRDVISRWIRSLLAGEEIRVYRPEGMFDYIYGTDSAEGLVRLSLASDVTGVVNLGTGRARKVGDVVAILSEHFPDARIVPADSDIPFEASEADISRLRDAMGWSPGYTLERAIPEIIEFERSRLGAREDEAGMPLRVLVTSASRKVPLIRAVQVAARRVDPRAIVVAGDVDPMAVARLVSDEFWEMPRSEDKYVEPLLRQCVERGIRVVLPTRDGELGFWSRHLDRFAAAGVEIVISRLPAIELCRDKLMFSEWGTSHGLPVIPATRTLGEPAAGRYVVKERFGAGSIGLGLDLDGAAARDHASGLVEPIFQPYIAGDEISIDAWITARGNVHGLVLRRRDRVVHGESQITTTFRDKGLEDQAEAVLSLIGLSGPVVMQAIVSAGKLSVIEVNPRFGGASTVSISAGLDLVHWSLLELLSPGNPIPPFLRRAREVRQIRLAQDITCTDPAD